jgi:DNA replication protein DnaC
MTDLAARLHSLGFRAPAEAIDALLKHAQKSRIAPAQLLEQLVQVEQRERDAKNLERRSRAAALGIFKTLDAFDWSHPRAIDRDAYEHIYSSLGIIKTGENVLIRGQAGVGKTTLAQNLGHHALESGYTVRYASLASMLADLMRQESLPAVERRMKRYTTPSLLILDELGYLPCDMRAADLLFNIVSRRHEKRSTVITTNLPFKAWGTVFQDAPCLSALIDRFAQHCHVIDIDADSWRDKERQQRQALSRAQKGRKP